MAAAFGTEAGFDCCVARAVLGSKFSKDHLTLLQLLCRLLGLLLVLLLSILVHHNRSSAPRDENASIWKCTSQQQEWPQASQLSQAGNALRVVEICESLYHADIFFGGDCCDEAANTSTCSLRLGRIRYMHPNAELLGQSLACSARTGEYFM